MARTIYTASNGNLYIVIQSGDTLSEIADAYLNPYGKSLGCKSSSEYQTWLKNTNKIKNANLIYDGDKLVLIKGYKITYYANGSTGAPGIQWKAYGQNLTLSRNKPTKAGYVFQGWNKTGLNQTTVDYAAGATYTTNAAMDLYPVWSASTYTVTYNANGGTGAPDSQKKKYNENINLSSDEPTRDGYEFVGWGTSASDILPVYYAGEKYTSNANITLYAIWKSVYNKPRITDLVVYRCVVIIDGLTSIKIIPQDDGMFGSVKFNWASDFSTDSVTIETKAQTSKSWTTKRFTPESTDTCITFNEDKKSGTVHLYFADETDDTANVLDSETAYYVKVTVTDSLGSTSITKILGGSTFTVDFASGGKSVGVGCIAPDIASGEPGVLEVGFQTKLTGGLAPVILPDADADLDKILTPGIYTSDNTIVYSNKPVEGKDAFTLEVYAAGNEGQRLQRFTVCHKTDSTTYERLYLDSAWGEWKCIYSMPVSDKIDYNSSLANEFSGNTPYTTTDGDGKKTYYLKYCSDNQSGNQIRSYITRNGTVVTMAFRTSSTTDVTAGTAYVLGTIPDSFKPANIVSTSGLFSIGTTVYNSCAIWVRANGQLCVKPYNTSTDGTTKFYEANLTWDLGATGDTWIKTTQKGR